MENPAAIDRGRAPHVAVERPHKIGEVLESDVQRDVGYLAIRVQESFDGTADPDADEVLVWRHPERAPEQPEEVERAEPYASGDRGEIKRLPGVRFHELGRRDRAIAIAARGADGTCAGGGRIDLRLDRFQKPMCNLVNSHIGSAVCSGDREA